MKKLLLLLLIVMAVPMTMMADDPVEINGIYYNLITKAKIAKVTSNPNGYSGDIVIPPTVTYNSVVYDVKEISAMAFYFSYNLISITIPNSVTTIGENAFWESGLTTIDIPNSVTTIGDGAFIYTGLTSINIPNSVTTIGKEAFKGCSSLTSVNIESGEIGKKTFLNCSNLTSVNIGSDVTSIGENAFEGCSNLTSVIIESGVVGANAFWNCSNLTSVNFGNGVTNIGNGAFEECSKLTSIDIPNSVTTIGERAFFNCKGLTSIDFGSGVTSIGNRAFTWCKSLTSIAIPNNVTTIGEYAFSLCEGLISIDIPNSVTSIETGVFSNCFGLTSIDIPNSVTSIGDYAFQRCTSLTSIDIPNSVTSIGDYAFNYCKNLITIVIPNSVTSIGSAAFQNCENLMVVTCHATSVPSTNTDAFNGSYVESATLIVPDASLSAYQSTAPWSNFGTILASSQATVVTANSYTREYGDANPNPFEYTSAVTLNGTPFITCAADATSAPGTYPITISQGTVTNTGLFFVDGTLTITKAPLTITANSYTIKEGDALPSYDAVFTGLKNNEQESVVSPVVSCTATNSTTPGTYPITVTATSDNYDITIEAGTLTILPTKMSITIDAPGVGTYCSPYDLDFSTVTAFKAYIATGYNSATGNVIVQAVKDVPAGTGLFLKGTPGTYDVPCGESSSYYVNMLVGVTEATTISATDGNMTNFLLSATNTSDACFRPISSTYNLKANRAYLQIPTYMVGSSAGANAVGIEFEEGVTGIDNSLSDMDANAHWFTLDGRRLNGKPTQKGIYVVNGQKVVIK